MLDHSCYYPDERPKISLSKAASHFIAFLPTLQQRRLLPKNEIARFLYEGHSEQEFQAYF